MGVLSVLLETEWMTPLLLNVMKVLHCWALLQEDALVMGNGVGFLLSVQVSKSVNLLFLHFCTYVWAGLRLAGGSNEAQGRVEIYYQGKWGTVCDEGWDINDGAVVCRQLGFQEVLSITNMATNFGPGSGPIQLQDVACVGTENNLFMCPLSSDIGEVSSCLHSNDAGVICGGLYVHSTCNSLILML